MTPEQKAAYWAARRASGDNTDEAWIDNPIDPHDSDERLMAKVILAEHKPDDDDAIDGPLHTVHFQGGYIEVECWEGGTTVKIMRRDKHGMHGGSLTFPVVTKTRGQLRRLLEALGADA